MLEEKLQQHVEKALQQALAAGILPTLPADLRLEKTTHADHGDFATNIALVAAKLAKKNPRELAQLLQPYLTAIPFITRVDIAGPGFLNLFLQPDFAASLLSEFRQLVLTKQPLIAATAQEKILVEFVSANPTGPLHIGHGRGAAVGDSIARLLKRVGHLVTTEYYINDAGRQMRMLGETLRIRALQALGHAVQLPEESYKGEYMLPIAENFLKEKGALFSAANQDEQLAMCTDYAQRAILDGIKNDLTHFRVSIDSWRSELELYKNETVSNVQTKLKQTGHTFEQDDALWFKSDDFGDEKPRVIIRDNGEPTYFMADIAYHAEKYARGFHTLLDFWGADHHGYEPRLRSAMKALGLNATQLEVHFIQFVSLLKEGQPVSMSTRAGTFETLRDLIEEVGIDAARFFYLLRRNESHLEFDLDLAKKQANDNPVYYVQYAHARICSLRRQAQEKAPDLVKQSFLPNHLTSDPDRQLLTCLYRYSDVLKQAATQRTVHPLVTYLQDLATAFHAYYNKQRVLDAAPADQTARFALVDTVGLVLQDGLTIIGVHAPETM